MSTDAAAWLAPLPQLRLVPVRHHSPRCAHHLRALMRRYKGDLTLVAAAYNAGIGTVSRYGGVPPYAETQEYVSKVTALYELYLRALGRKQAPERPAL